MSSGNAQPYRQYAPQNPSAAQQPYTGTNGLPTNRWRDLNLEDKTRILRAASILENSASLTLQSLATHQSVPQTRLRLERDMIGLAESRVPIEWEMDFTSDTGDLEEQREPDAERLAAKRKWSARAEKAKMWGNAMRAAEEGMQNAQRMMEIDEEYRKKNASASPMSPKQEGLATQVKTESSATKKGKKATKVIDSDSEEDEEDAPPVRRRKIKSTFANQRRRAGIR